MPTSKLPKLYDFLLDKFSRNQSFTDEEAGLKIGYKPSTIQTYIRKKLINFIVDFKNDEYYVRSNIRELGLNKFLKHMNQTSQKCKISRIS